VSIRGEKNKESAMDWRERISVDPNVCHGRVCIKGTRVMVSVILDNLAAGESPEAIMHGYNIEKDQIEACVRYAAEKVRSADETRIIKADPY